MPDVVTPHGVESCNNQDNNVCQFRKPQFPGSLLDRVDGEQQSGHYNVMENEPEKETPTNDSGIPTTDAKISFSSVWTGAIGLTKAALHVDRAAEPLIRQRRAICAACPKATAGSSRTSRCQACTCFIHPKTAITTEKCPLGNW